PWPQVVVVLANEGFLWPAEQVFTRAIEPDVPQRLGIFEEKHDGNVLDDCVEECVGVLEFLLDALTLADVHAQRLFSLFSLGDVVEEDGDVPLLGPAESERVDVVEPAEGMGRTLKPP